MRASWYGEGEVKIYRDGDTDLPTICGTGLEDYVGSAWGIGAHHAPYGGAPLSLGPARRAVETQPDFVGFYRWHVPDPVMFEHELRVTIQQIGAMFFLDGQEQELAEYEETHPVAGEGWMRDVGPGLHAWGIAERVDDYCATAFVYCREPQPVPRLDCDARSRRHRAPGLRTGGPAGGALRRRRPPGDLIGCSRARPPEACYNLAMVSLDFRTRSTTTSPQSTRARSSTSSCPTLIAANHEIRGARRP